MLFVVERLKDSVYSFIHILEELGIEEVGKLGVEKAVNVF
jgi:hypothetical protein